MVEQRIYIPYATDNWLVWVRLPPEVPYPGLLFYVIKERPLNDRRGGTLGLDLTVPL
jgi:hypothetical protein